ncbi:cadherin-related family member 2 [Salarias fasciatus]|uniref:cadherin-related family member 2 n=1 Tax=Salarias fasciatus TaxID=181472 RepID=UPI001176B5BD|nr:cadherin-related family member 2 [Salarias fasciatus]
MSSSVISRADMERITTSVLLLCLISLTRANRAPDITQVIYTVCEDTPKDRPAFTIKATDVDNDPLTFDINGINANFFEVDADTGVVSVKTILDRESNNLLELDAIVSDGTNPTSERLFIILDDANDNRPIFNSSSYDFSFPENTAVGTSLFRVYAADGDTGDAGVVRYNIDDVIPSVNSSFFSISPTTGEVRLIKSLNHTQNTFFRLKINATDNGGSCFFNETVFNSNAVFSIITVLDVPDLDPVFVGLPYTARIEENSPQNTFVFKVTAVDQDTGVNDPIIYSIEDSTEDGLFNISESDGVISVQKEFDRELQQEFDILDVVTLTVKATESNPNIHGVQASTTVIVTINIVDVNDETPKFYKCGGGGCVEATEFTGQVVEHQLGSVPINMTVIDRDQWVNTKLTLEGEHKDSFSVEPQESQLSENVVQLIIRNSQNLDYEIMQQTVLQVIATDGENTSFRSTATVTINILDANDNSPSFPNDTYTFDVPEHSEDGTTVTTLTATDPDTMDAGKITYRLLPATILSIFDVEPHTGRIYVKSKALLDREIRSTHSMTLEARDTANQIGTAVLEITVTDINDQSPVMNRESYTEFVREGEQVNVRIEAMDSDEPGTPNSEIVYAIVPSAYSENFTINASTGELRNSGELDREALDSSLEGRIELNVTATDRGVPQRSTSVIVTIIVEDVNDNSPRFEDHSYNFTVREGDKGAFVGLVFAQDMDQSTVFNRVSFSIVDGGSASFMIRTSEKNGVYIGNITVDPTVELDYENEQKRFTLLIEAADLDQRKAQVTVEVDVVDVNDERPEFLPSSPVPVKENTATATSVGSFAARDRDGNHSLVFELESVRCRCNSSMTTCSWFDIDPTGEVRVRPGQTIDYEQCDQAVVTAQVVDEYTEKGENNSVTPGEMVINIEDVNDNAPQFILSDAVFVVVSEGANKGTSVARVTAVDLDSGVNRQMEFTVTGVQFEDLNDQVTTMRLVFEVVTTQQQDTYVGIIQNTEGLDLTLKGKYLVNVTATDTGGLSSATTLGIFTVDESYRVELEFTSTGEEFDQKLNEIRRALVDATGTSVEIVATRGGTNEATRVLGNTVVVAYFVFPNGTALTADEVERMLSDPNHYPRLSTLGLRYIGQSPGPEAEANPVQYILLGIVGGLIIILIVLTTSLLCTRRNYRRKLKAANAMKSASMMNSDNLKSGAMVPGTNKYTQEGANPVLNLNIESSIALDLDDESLDVDKVSLNSLDDDMTFPEKGTKINELMIEEAEEDDYNPPKYTEPLGQALAQRGQRKNPDTSLKGITNPIFNTSDL